jgi:hypothetical protein
VGIYRAIGFNGADAVAWQRLPTAPIGTVSLAVSPRYEQDHTLFAGTNTGVFVSRDEGESWVAGKTPIEGAVVNSISFSPSFEQDGCLLAGTLEDGLLFSADRGLTWHSRNFGLLDAAAFSTAFSPDFPKDDTAFAGTDTALYHSHNGARAWQMSAFPDSAPPVMSLAVSPNFEHDGSLFAGTEAEGLYRSTDRGATWAALNLPAASISALVFRAAGDILAATDAGVFRSQDLGDTWACVLDQPNVISLAAIDDVAAAGLADQGAWVTTDLQTWLPAGALSARPVIGLVLPGNFEEDGVALMYGPTDGIWRTADGGRTWEDVNDDLPTLDVRAVAISPNFADDKLAVAATDAGVLISHDAGRQWTEAATEPASLLSFSANGKWLAAGLSNGELRISNDLGRSWRAVEGAWDAGARLVALAVGNAGQVYVAVVEGIGETLGVWQGLPGAFEKVHSQVVGENPVVSFWIPSEPAADRPWYAALGSQVLKFSSRKGRTATTIVVFGDGGAGENLLVLAGVQGPGDQVLFAATGRNIYKSTDGINWTLAHDFGDDRAVAMSVSPNYLKDKTLYALLIGGTFARLIVR